MTDAPRSTILPALPLKSNVLFPHLLLPLAVGRKSSVAAVDAALLTEDKRLVIVAQRDPLVEEPRLDDLYKIGTLAAIKKMERGDAGLQIIVQGMERVELIEAVETEPYFKLRVNSLPEPTDDGTEVEALGRAMLDQAAAVHALLQPEAPFTIQQMFAQVPDVLHQAYLLASMLNLDIAKSQALLEANSRTEARADGAGAPHARVASSRVAAEDHQPGAVGTEPGTERIPAAAAARAIQEELGDRNPEQADAAEMRRRLDEADLPENVRKEATRELNRLERLPTAAPDYQLTRSYLELLLELPWQATTEDVLDLARAGKCSTKITTT